MASSGLKPEAFGRFLDKSFARLLESIDPQPVSKDSQPPTNAPKRYLWVGLSGGLDSVVLLHSVHRWYLSCSSPKNGGFAGLRAVHVHHGLSPNADAWAVFCRQICQALDVPLSVEAVEVSSSRGGLEQAARQARYAVFNALLGKDDLLLLAHHSDDQLETFFMRATRGAGLQGLKGIPQTRTLAGLGSTRVFRPFLSLTRNDLARYAEAMALDWIEDESNQDQRFERNWWRQQLLPEVWKRFPGRRSSTAGTLSALAQDAEALDWLLRPHIDHCLTKASWPNTARYSLGIQELSTFPRVVQIQLIRAWLSSVGCQLPSSDWIDQLFDSVIQAGVQAQPSLAVQRTAFDMGLVDQSVRRFRGRLFVTGHPVNEQDILSESALLSVDSDAEGGLSPSTIRWRGGHIQSDANAPALADGRYQIRPAAAFSSSEVKIRMAGRPSKNLKQLWQAFDVPVWLRPEWPVLLRDGKAVALVGLAVDAAYAPPIEQPFISGVTWC